MSADAFLPVAFIIGYLFGSIPFGLILTRLAGTQDLRSIGSGNIGATNVLRTGRKGLAAATLILDALKGTAAVIIAGYCAGPNAAMLSALGAFLGHLFPVWLKFRGGKGVATGLGAWLAFAPKSVVVMVAVFVLMVAIFRYISLGSVTAAAIFPLAARVRGDDHGLPVVLGCMAASSLLIILKHSPNIRRLMTGTENKFRSGSK
jgi:glycerol-3-phosphate acyltransferase PlsY